MHIMWCFIQPTPLILIWLGTSQKAGRVEIDFIVPAQITIACLKVGWFNRVKQLLFGLVAQYCVSLEVNNFTVVETQYWATSNTICFKTSAIHTISPCPIKEPSTFKFDFFDRMHSIKSIFCRGKSKKIFLFLISSDLYSQKQSANRFPTLTFPLSFFSIG